MKRRKKRLTKRLPFFKFLAPFSLTALYGEAALAASIRRSLNLIILGNLCGNMFSVICGGGTTAMVGLANAIHAGDFTFGVINGIPQMATLLQIPFSILVSRTHHRKKYMLTFGLLSRFLWILFGLIPLVVPTDPAWLPSFTLIFLLGISSACGAAINVCWFPWFSDLAPKEIRGRWFSARDTLVALCNLLFGLLTARLLDTLPEERRYVIIFLIGGIIGIGISYGLSYVINHYGQQVFGALLNAGSLWGGSTESQISVIPFWLPFLAAGFAMMVGVVSGYYPASRATKISAIEALRNE